MRDHASHDAEHSGVACFNLLQPSAADLIRIGSRRWFLQTGVAGLAGLSLPNLLRCRTQAAPSGSNGKKAVILIWLSGGPSHLETWDPKPDAPCEVRGPFASIATRVPGVRVCEYLPLQASIMNRLALVRSVDCRSSIDHYPAPMQAGNSLAQRSRITSTVPTHPSMGAVAARFRGANHPQMPAFIGLAEAALYHADILSAGPLGAAYEPAPGAEMAGRLALPHGVNVPRAQDRDDLRRQFDRLQRELDHGDSMARMDHYNQQALAMVLSGRARQAFRLDQEPDRIRDRYGRNSFGEKALLARRLVEAGVTFVLVSGAWGYFDHHGDDVVWGGIVKGLKPLLPRVDRVVYALINDLESRGLLDTTLVLMLGEFGREPVMSRTAGRGHWTNCMSMLIAGGGLPCGQVIGSTDHKGYDIKDRRVGPADLAATVFHHLGIDPGSHWIDPQGRPVPIITEGGQPIAELT